MTKKFRLTILVLMLSVAIFTLAACNSASVVSVSITEDSVYKTNYIVGEDLDINGIVLSVELSDGKSKTVNATDVRDNLKITGFSTETPADEREVVLNYKGVKTSYTISVVSATDDTQKCKVTFETGAGSKIDDVYVFAYTSISAPTEPVRDGYAFDGWYKESTYNDQWNFNTDKIVTDVTLYAKWAKLYVITFKDEVNGLPDILRYVKAGDALTDVPALPTIEGKVGSWSRTVFTNINANITVHSEYSDIVYKVRFVYLESDGKTQTEIRTFDALYGENLSVTKADEIQELIDSHAVPATNDDGSKSFVGWNETFDHIVSDRTIIAVYSPTKYSVTFDLNYEVGSSESQTFEVKEGIPHGNTVTEPTSAPSRDGYVFDGWYRQPECTLVWNFNTDKVTETRTLYAKWTKLIGVRYLIPSAITIDEEVAEEDPLVMEKTTVNGVEYKIYFIEQVRYQDSATLISVPNRRGYSGKWNISNAMLAKLENNVDVKVEYTVNKYTVRFYNYDHTACGDAQEVEFQGSAVAPSTNPVREGYTFTGWDKDFSCVEEDMDITAEFEASEYTVRFHINDESGRYEDVTVKYDSIITFDKELTRSGYNFAGWYSDPACTKAFDISKEVLKETEVKDGVVLSLYAKWNYIYTIEFYNVNEEGETAYLGERKVEAGYVLTDIPTPDSREGYNVAWREAQKSGSVLNFSTDDYDFQAAVKSNASLYAYYTIKSYIVGFYVDNERYQEVSVEHGGKIEIDIDTPNVTSKGKIFLNWDKDYKEIVITKDTVITAVLRVMVFTVIWGDTGVKTEVEYGDPALFPSSATPPTKRGYTLTGWIAPSGFDISSIRADEEQTITLTPNFVRNDYTVQFKSATGEIIDEYTQKYDSLIDVDGVNRESTEEGRSFVGWNFGEMSIYYSSDETSCKWFLTGDPQKKASKVNKNGCYLALADGEYYYLEASEDGRAGVINKLNSENWERNASKLLYDVASGKWLTSKYDDATKEWTEVGSSSARDIGFDGVFYIVREEASFVALYKDVTYEVKFDACANVKFDASTEETNIKTVNVKYGGTVSAPEVERDGYVLLGWYRNEDLTEKFDFATETITEDITLYAKWEAYTENPTEGLEYALSDDGKSYTLVIGKAEGTEITVTNYYEGKPVTAVATGAFANNDKLKSITLPNTLVTMGPQAFMNCSALTSVTIPAGVKTIPDNAFNGCIGLKEVIFDEDSTLTTIGKSAFSGDIALSALSLPDTLTAIGEGAFHNNKSLVGVVIPESVVSIGDRAFAGTDSLRYVKFERSVPCSLGADAFLNSTALYNGFRIYVPEVKAYQATTLDGGWQALTSKVYDSSRMTSEWSYTLSNKGVLLEQYLGTATNVVVPSAIGESIVYGLGNYVFDPSIESVELASSLTLSQYTFGSATNITVLKITVGDKNELQAEYLTNAFEQCEKLNTISLSNAKATLSDMFGKELPSSLTKVVIKGSVYANLLANCAYVKEVEIIGAERVGENAFLNCVSLTSVTFDNVVDITIEKNAFNGCKSLGAEGFSYYNAEREVVNDLPDKVTEIGEDAFADTAWYTSNTNDMIIVGKGIFYKYRGKSSVVTIPSTVTMITAYAFADNASITRVYVEDPTNSSMSNIGEYAFRNCVKLESVLIPAGVKNINTGAFSGCEKLATIALLGTATKKSTDVLKGTPDYRRVYAPALSAESSGETYADWGGKRIYIEGMNVFAKDEACWLYGQDPGSGNGIVLIKYLGTSDDVNIENGYTIGESTVNVNYLADYAFARTTKSLTFSADIKAYKDALDNTCDNVFGGVTELTSLKIESFRSSDSRMSATLLNGLLQANTKLTAIDIPGAISVQTLFGATLPSHVTRVNVIGSKIADEFLKGSDSVSDIYVTIGKTQYALEDTKDLQIVAADAVSIGVDAFEGTSWLARYSGDFVVVLDGLLIAYKGKSAVLDIPGSVKSINDKAFNQNTFIEVVTIPSTVTKIGAEAFGKATNLTRVFVKATEVPSAFNGTFYNGTIVYVPSGAYDKYIADAAWKGFNPQSDDGVVNFTLQLNEYTLKGVTYKVCAQYIVDSTSKTLLLARKYTESYVSDVLTSVEEGTSVAIGTSVSDGEVTYNIEKLGAKCFMRAVESVSLDITVAVVGNAFDNLGSLGRLEFTGINGELKNRGTTSESIRNIINARKIDTISYDGSVTLEELLEANANSDMKKIETVTRIEIYEGVTSTVDELLVGYNNITDIVYPDSILEIGVGSFEDTAWYKQYSGNFVILGGVLYKYKGSESTVVIPASVTIINKQAFASNARVSGVRFESGSAAHTICESAFKDCTLLSAISLPSSMVHVAASAFDGTKFTYQNGALLVKGDSDDRILVRYTGTDTDTVYTIPATVTTILANAFEGNATLKTVNFESGSRLSKVHEYAFKGASDLSEIILNESALTYIGKGAFEGTPWLNAKLATGEDVQLGSVMYLKQKNDNTTSDGKKIFEITSKITSVTDGALDVLKPTKIVLGSGAYLPPSELYKILTSDGVTAFGSDGSLPLSELIGTQEVLKNITTLSFEDATSICAGYADGWTCVEEVVSVNVTSIGEYAFRDTAWLNSMSAECCFVSDILIRYNGKGGEVTVGSEYIGSPKGITPDVFRGNTSITSISFYGNKITEIPERAFEGCTNLAEILLPDSVVTYGKDAFAGTAWINNIEGDYVVMNGRLIGYTGEGGDIVIPEEVDKIYSYVFSGDDRITSVTFSRYNLMSEIDVNTFANCANLESIILSENIDVVDRDAFTGTAWASSIAGTTKYLYYEDSYNGVKKIVLYLGTDADVLIPQDVTEISQTAFSGVTTIKTLTVAEGSKLTEIPTNAFKDCTALEKVTLASSVTKIGVGAFANTKWLSAATDDFVVLNGRLISYRGSDTAVMLPDTVSVIGKDAFGGNESVTSLVIADSVVTIEEYAFDGCEALENVTFGSAIREIGAYAFRGTSWLNNSATDDDGFVTVGDVVIAYKGTASEVTYPKASKLNADVFAGNTSITKITFTSDVDIADYAFEGCKNLATVAGEEYITSAGAHAFSNTLWGSEKAFTVVNGALISYNGTSSEVTIPADVTRICATAFAGNKNIIKVDFSAVTGNLVIDDGAFKNCVALAEVILTENITHVGARAFYNTNWVRNSGMSLIMTEGGRILAYVAEEKVVSIPAGATSIADGVFAGNKNIITVSFASDCKLSIPAYAFKGCTSLTNVIFASSQEIGEGAFEGTQWLTIESNKSATRGYVIVGGRLIAYTGGSTEIVIPSSVTYIYDYVFGGNTSITKLSFAGIGIAELNGKTFSGCTALEDVTLPTSLNYLDMSVFEGTAWRDSITDGYVISGNKLLAYIGSATELVIPNSVNSLGRSVFAGNTAITSVTFESGSYVTAIPEGTFSGCTSLSKIVLPSGLKDVGKDAFKDTPWIQSIASGEEDVNGGSVKDDVYTFNGIALIYLGESAEFTMPSSVTHVSASFFSAGGISVLILPSSSASAINAVKYETGALNALTEIRVPESLLSVYKSSANWQLYATKIVAVK